MNDLSDNFEEYSSDSELDAALKNTSLEAEKDSSLFSKSMHNDIEKAKDVSKQFNNFDELVSVRLHLQRSLTLANNIPTGVKYHVLASEEGGNHGSDLKEGLDIIKESLSCLMDDFIELQADILQVETRRKIKIDKEQSMGKKLARLNNEILEYSFDEGDKLISKILLSADLQKIKFKSINQSLKSQVERGVPLAKPKILIANNSISQNDSSIASSPNDLVYDDSMVLSHLFQGSKAIAPQSTVVKKKTKKQVDTKASKGRKIRYEVHSKIQNLMTPMDVPTWPEEKTKELFNSLFKSKNASFI